MQNCFGAEAYDDDSDGGDDDDDNRACYVGCDAGGI